MLKPAVSPCGKKPSRQYSRQRMKDNRFALVPRMAAWLGGVALLTLRLDAAPIRVHPKKPCTDDSDACGGHCPLD
jgi:hypothetical protein